MTPLATLPDGYELVELGGARAFAVAAAVPWLRGTLAAGVRLAQWAEAQPEAESRSGRGRVHVVPAAVPGPDGHDRWAVRHYRRGGAVARPLLGDRYLSLGAPRAFRELAASHEARLRGIPTPAVVAAAVYPGGVFHRADLVTEMIPEGGDLAEVLFATDEPPLERARAALAAAGGLIRRMAQAGVRHPDLNAKNVLLTWSGETAHAHLLDLDACTVVDGTLPTHPMCGRLERSLHKLERRSGRLLRADALAELRRGSGGQG